MREVTIEESRKIQLDILIHFDKWCNQHKLHYSIGEGTLIGAVRHQGFIPWDDDIDLLMPRYDFDKFVELYDGEYRLISLRTEKRWWSCYVRLTDERTIVNFNNPKHNFHGLWISILPIDNYPDDQNKWIVAQKKLNVYFTIGKIKDSYWTENTSFVKNLTKYLLKSFFLPVSYNFIGRKCQRILNSFSDKESKRKGLLACLWLGYWVYDASVFSNYTEVEFEGRRFSAWENYDAYLRGQYGDYMQLPPEEKRLPLHNYKAFWKN